MPWRLRVGTTPTIEIARPSRPGVAATIEIARAAMRPARYSRAADVATGSGGRLRKSTPISRLYSTSGVP